MDEDDQDFFARMAEVVARRYQLNADKTLRDVYHLHPNFLQTQIDAEFAIHNRDRILAVLADPRTFARLVDLFVVQAIEFTYASNQFIQIDPGEEDRLRSLYQDYLRAMQRVLALNTGADGIAAGLDGLVKAHFQDLSANITRFFDAEISPNAHSNVILQKVVCADYTPETQMKILGLRLETLQPPVLDLGCGRQGLLVQHLRRLGAPVTGVDRLVDPGLDLVQGDWLDFALQPGEWGAVISHMAFTNHFLFHHLYQKGSIVPYARQYMAILTSLQPGGSFYYAPGLPFIEAHLPPDTYRVVRRRIVDALYACRVTRLK